MTSIDTTGILDNYDEKNPQIIRNKRLFHSHKCHKTFSLNDLLSVKRA